MIWSDNRPTAEREDLLAAVMREMRLHAIGERHRVLRLYRLWLQATILHVSPLAIDLAAHGGFTIEGVARELDVPPGWTPQCCATTATLGMAGQSHASCFRRGARGIFVRTGAAVMRGPTDAAGMLGFYPRDRALDVVSCFGPTVLYTSGLSAHLWTPERLPEIVLAGLVGKPIDAVAPHPVLDGRGYLIRKVRDRPGDGGTMLSFRPGLLPLRLPWAGDLTQVVERRSRRRSAHDATPTSDGASCGLNGVDAPGRRPRRPVR